MTIRHVLLLAVTPIALLAFGLGGVRSAQELSAQTGGESIVGFVRG